MNTPATASNLSPQLEESLLMQVLEEACAALPLGVADLLRALSPEDIDDIKAGGIPLETVQAFARVVAATGPWMNGEPVGDPAA